MENIEEVEVPTLSEELEEDERLYNELLQSKMMFTRSGRDTLGVRFQPYVRKGKKIGRNEECECGSGKKYKNCCIDL